MTARARRSAPIADAVPPVGLWRCGGGSCSSGANDFDDEQVHREAAGRGPGVAPPIVTRALNSSGSPLPAPVRRDAEAALGHDFGQVRVHDDDLAAESAKAVSAHAYTVGSHVVFGRGNFAPTTSSGRRLLFHELVHTTQQASAGSASPSGVARSALSVSTPDDPAEVAAERIAAAALARPVRAVSNESAPSEPMVARCGPVACPPGTCGHDDDAMRLPQGMVMRQAVLADAPPDLPCELSADPGHTPGTDITFAHESSDLSLLGRLAIVVFVDDWKAAGSTDDVTIDGWASTDGPQGLNWRLSCERAAVVRAELESRGIPTSKMKVVAHGETTEFSATELAPNRRVIISRTPAVAPAPQPAPGPNGPNPPAPQPAPAAVETITSETVLTTPGARTRRTVGVGEQVRLTHSPGAATWTKTDGTLSATSGVTVTWTAPDTRKHAAIRANGAWIDFEVIAPTDVHMDRFPGTGVKHTQNRPDSGIEVQPFLLPDNVNFRNVQYRELNVAAVANGVYACFGAGTTGHCAQPAGGGCPPLTMTSTVVGGKGTQATLADCVYSGDCGTAAPFPASRIVFDIPYEYRVGAGPFRRFRVVHQESNVAGDGVTLTSIKVGARGTTTVAAATVAIADCP